MNTNKIARWITIKGNHIPIYVKNDFKDIGLEDIKTIVQSGFSNKSIEERETIGQQLKDIINPNYTPGDGNCGKCSLAFALQMRGIDVEALNGVDGGAFFDAYHFTSDDYVNNFAVGDNSLFGKKLSKIGNKNSLGGTVKSVTDGIMNHMKNWGDGTVAILNVQNVGPGGHAMNMVNIGGHVFLVDTQIGRILKTRSEIERFIITKDVARTILVRVDNVDLHEDWQNRCKDHVRFKNTGGTT